MLSFSEYRRRQADLKELATQFSASKYANTPKPEAHPAIAKPPKPTMPKPVAPHPNLPKSPTAGGVMFGNKQSTPQPMRKPAPQQPQPKHGTTQRTK